MNESISLRVLDTPGAGNACHVYEVRVCGIPTCTIHFQDGPLQEVGANGLSNEVLLAIVRDRLEGFQSGDFACKENEKSLFAVIDALTTLQSRTADRKARGVEGKSVL